MSGRERPSSDQERFALPTSCRIVDSENGDRRGCPAQPLRTSAASSDQNYRQRLRDRRLGPTITLPTIQVTITDEEIDTYRLCVWFRFSEFRTVPFQPLTLGFSKSRAIGKPRTLDLGNGMMRASGSWRSNRQKPLRIVA